MIGTLSLATLASRLQLPWPGADVECSGVSTDTRTLQPGDLFVALRGDQHDGHQHLQQAQQRGAVAAIVEQRVESPLPQLVVFDSRRALGELARVNRERFSGHLVALTGSAGKTTTKNMAASILAQAGATLATCGNLNNEIGVPLTLLAIGAQHRFAVVEMGAARRGDIAYLMQFVQPEAGLVTNVLPAHLSGFGNLDTVAQSKGEIYQCLPEAGTAVINADLEYTALWREFAGRHRVLTFGWQGEHTADVTARQVRSDERGCIAFTLVLPQGEYPVSLPVPGFQNVSNALGAAALALAVGCRPEHIATGLAAFRNDPGRLSVRSSKSGCRLVDDSYNANPGSVKSAIDVLAEMPARRVLILGEMAELGERAGDYHEEVAVYAKRRGVEALWVVGPWAGAMAAVFGHGARAFAGQAELVAHAVHEVRATDSVLVKGSRRARMETVVEALAAEATPAGGH